MAAEVEIVGWKMNQAHLVGLRRRNYQQEQYQNCVPSWVPPQYRSYAYSRMKRSSATVDPPPQCALSPQDATLLGNSHRVGKDNKNYPFSPVNRGSGRNPRPMQRQPKREPQPVNQAWSNTTFENSNTSWEGDWSNASSTPPIKTEPSPTGYYNHRTTGSFQSSSEWSPGESSASSSMMPAAYGTMHTATPQQSPSNSSRSASSSSYYESNGFYGSGYNNYSGGGYMQAPYGTTAPQQHQYHESVRTFDAAAGSYNNHRNPSSCPPQNLQKQPMPDYQRKQTRYPMDGMSRIQIKREPEDYNEVDGDNFTSLFTKSLTSLYSQDAENAFAEEHKPYEPDLVICSPAPLPGMEEQSTYQRLSAGGGGQYNVNAANDYQDGRSNFGFYDGRNQNCDNPQPSVSVVEELGTDGDRMNSFRYDRPSFDDMHLYTSTPNETKSQTKKRKINMPSATPESGCYPGTENRKKTPRIVPPSYKSDSQWTPNSFAFSDIQIKQEPIDDYGTSEVMDTPSCSGLPFKESSPSSNGTGGNKSPGGQQPDHPKQPPRKRSPGATCFDRFDKKSTPTNKKVSPLSVYAKVQENIVLSVKCRRYKKRTKPITSKEESVCPGREEMELYKQNSLTPDQAAHQVMGELLERVSLFEERSVIDGPNLTQMDAMKVRELLMQFCHRYSLDYRDFEDINGVLKPRIINDSSAKNSERASAIRKRTSTSPVQTEAEPQPVRKALSRIATTTKKASVEEETRPFVERRVLRSLPGRVDRCCPANDASRGSGRRYSTRSGRDATGERSAQVDIVISSSTESESEAGKDAEVRKKSQRLKRKTAATPARSRTSSKASAKSTERVEETPRVCTRSRESKDVVKTADVPDANRINLRSRRDRIFRKYSSDSMRSSSVEILDITRSPWDDIIDAVIAEPFVDKGQEKNSNKRSKPPARNKGSRKASGKRTAGKRRTSRNSTRKNPVADASSPEVMSIEKEEDSIVFLNSPNQLKGRSRRTAHKRRARKNAEVEVNSTCDTSEIEELEPLQKLKESSRKLKNEAKNSEAKGPANPASCDVVIVKEELSPKQLKNTSKNSGLKNSFDKSLPTNDLVNSKSHFSAIKMKEHFPNQLDREFKPFILTSSSKPLKSPKNDKVQIDPFVRLSDDLKVHQDLTTSNTPKTRSLSNSTKPSKLLKKNSIKSEVDSQFIDTTDTSEQQNLDKSLISHPFSSKSSKPPKESPVAPSEPRIEPNESLKVLSDLAKSVTTKSLPETSKSRKMSEDNVKPPTDSPLKSCDTYSQPKERSRKPKSPTDSTKPSKLSIDRSKKFVDPSTEAIDVTKLSDNPRKTLTSQPEVIKSSKPAKDNTENSLNSLVEPTNNAESLKETSRKSVAATPVQEPRVSSKASCRKVDDLVAAVSSLVESEKESKLLESDKKTIAAHSLLELGNSPQFLKVGSISTPVHRNTKSEIIDRVSPTSKSSSSLTSSSDSMTSTDSWKFVKENYEKPEVVGPACNNNSAACDKPATTVNTPFAYYNTTSYEKSVAVNTPYVYRSSEKYEKQVVVNTPFIYRNSGNYEKPVAVNTPHIYRNSDSYQKPVAVNTPYIYRNSGNRENPAVANPSPLRNSQRLRKARDRRPAARIDSTAGIDTHHPLVTTSDATKSSLQKSNEDYIPPSVASRVHYQSPPKDSKATPDSNGSTGPCTSTSKPPAPVESASNRAEVKSRRPRRFSRSPSKLTLVRSCSQLSESEPQVVLTKLPDVHVNSEDGSVSAEMVKLCEMTEGRNSSLTKKHKSRRSFKSSGDKPPVLVAMKAVAERASSPTSSLSASPPCIHSLEDTDLPVNLTTASEKTRHSMEVVPRLRSESEDSDCGLVIDLERRTSVEERVPSPTLQSSDIIDGMKKASVSEDPRSFFSDQPVPSTSNDGTDRSAEEKEASHTLLELTRSMLPPMSSSLTGDSDDHFSSAESEERRRGRRAREVRERARDESILRTLLLETGAIGPAQDRSQPGSDSSTLSADSKDPITQEITRLLLLCETNDEDSLSESTSIDDRKFPLEIITDLNANSLITDLEADHQDIKEQIRKLKNEIVYLKCIADKKDRERTAVVCFKRSSSLSEESVQIIHQTTSTSSTRESTFGTTDSNPLSMPDLSPRRNSSNRLRDDVTSRHVTQSPPFLQSEFGASENSAFSATSSSTSQKHPISLVVSEKKQKSSRKVNSCTATSNSRTRSPSNHSTTPPRHIPNSSLWSRDRIARNSFAASSMDGYQSDRTETISSSMGSSYINRFSSGPFMLPPHPTRSMSNSSRHPKSEGHGRKSAKTNARTYSHSAEGEQLALSYSSLMNSSSSVVPYRAPIVMGSPMVITDTSGASAPTGPPKCMGCGIEDGVLLCSGCRKHWYCSPKCQNLRWPEHKNECGSASGNIYNPGPSTSFN